jgi:3,4-dehydroadipyl-CoA semialdehyde dehydrogenase
MSELLPNFLQGQWQTGSSKGTPLFDPVLGDELVRVDATGHDLAAAFAFARETGGAALRAMTYPERAAMLGNIAKLLGANKDAYYEISTRNSGTVKNDTMVDVDGGIFTLGYFARLGGKLPTTPYLLDGAADSLSKDGRFQSTHILSPRRGVALLINAFNFPSWGLWEKAAPALLSGVPIIVKPATATAWLTQRMVKDVVDAGLVPAGAISVICGSSAGLMDQLQPFDMVSFTGSAATAGVIRRHPAVAERSVRVNIEADSLNSAWLVSGANEEAESLLVKEVAREMTVKAGQKCTAIRRIFVPRERFDAVAQAISARLAKTTVGNPRLENVRMGSLVSMEQLATIQEGLAQLKTELTVLHDGSKQELLGVEPGRSACIAPTLLGCLDGAASKLVHEVEVFGPVSTLIAYDSADQAAQLIARGEGSLVASVYHHNAQQALAAASTIAHAHGRLHIITPDIADIQTGHGNVMPNTLHGGPGRAGGGEELGGIRGLNFYHQRTGVQASQAAWAGV